MGAQENAGFRGLLGRGGQVQAILLRRRVMCTVFPPILGRPRYNRPLHLEPMKREDVPYPGNCEYLESGINILEASIPFDHSHPPMFVRIVRCLCSHGKSGIREHIYQKTF